MSNSRCKRARLPNESASRASSHFTSRRGTLAGIAARLRKPISAGNAHIAIGDFEIAGTGFELVGGELLQIVGKLPGGVRHRGATGRDGARAAGAEAGRN